MINNKYLIDSPPPTISGNLHMGHAFSYIQMDFIARYHKMKNKELIYPFSYDNNGIPTEKFAYSKGISNENSIIELSIETSKIYKKLFDDLEIGYTEDSYNSFDESAKKITILSFKDLKNKNLIYKDEEEYDYCTTCKCSITKSEIENNKHIRDNGEIILKKGYGWFIKTLEFKEEFKKQIEKIDIQPIKFKERLISWIDNLDRDWSISRERNYGISIPGEDRLKFDTWFTSSLTPQLSYSSYTKKDSLECPIFDLRFQAHDIINTWAFYTIIKSYHHNKQIPWKKLIITGHAIDEKGEKLSKSIGNFSTPYTYINEYGSNGIRYWAARSKIGTDTIIDDNIMNGGNKLPIKLKNAMKFIKFQQKKGWLGRDINKELEWKGIKNEIEKCFNNSDTYSAFHTLYDFFFSRLCDIFIEESKKESCPDSLEDILNDMMPYFKIFFPNIEYD